MIACQMIGTVNLPILQIKRLPVREKIDGHLLEEMGLEKNLSGQQMGGRCIFGRSPRLSPGSVIY